MLTAIDCTAKPDGDYADPSNVCSQRYYTCANGITFRRDCNSGLYFDPDQMNCQRYENVRLCGGQPLQTAQSAADIICSKVTGNIVDPDSDGCSRNFYACNGGKAIKTKCADPGHAFNAKTDRCEVKKTIEGCGKLKKIRNILNLYHWQAFFRSRLLRRERERPLRSTRV